MRRALESERDPFHGFEVVGVLGEVDGVAAEFLAEETEAGEDEGAGAMEFAGELVDAQAFGTEEEQGEEGDFAGLGAVLQVFGQGPELAGGRFVDGGVFGFRAEAGEDFAGGAGGDEGAVEGEAENGLEREEAGADSCPGVRGRRASRNWLVGASRMKGSWKRATSSAMTARRNTGAC